MARVGRASMDAVSWVRHPSGRVPGCVEVVTAVLDPVLEPLGFAPGQGGGSDGQAQVIYCRGAAHGTDSDCVDLVIDLVALPGWQITDVRYWGLPADRWHLEFDRQAALGDQVSGLAETLLRDLA